MPTVLERITGVDAPPTVQLFRLPSHKLVTLNAPVSNGQTITVYAGDGTDVNHPLEMMLERVGRNGPRDGSFPWIEPIERQFIDNHCRTCPRMLAASTMGSICPAAMGNFQGAFDQEEPVAQAVDFNVNPDPIGLERQPRTRRICREGHPQPQVVSQTGTRWVQPTMFMAKLPISYNVTLFTDSYHEGERHNIDGLFVRFLASFNNTFFQGQTARAFNTWSGGGICWGSGNYQPELAEATERIYGSKFNIDLTDNFRRQIRDHSTLYVQFATFLDYCRANDPSHAASLCNFRAIDSNKILSLDNEVNALLSVPRPSNRHASADRHYATALAMLLASGTPMGDNGILLPLKLHSIAAGESYINGYITPILPEINRCWFIQANNNSRNSGLLLGQIEPPTNP
jgi:hypothetical protein